MHVEYRLVADGAVYPGIDPRDHDQCDRVFLHRHQAHRSLDLHPIASHFFRFWLWLTTGSGSPKSGLPSTASTTPSASRRKTPHSPHVHGIKTVLFQGAELYRAESKNKGNHGPFRPRYSRMTGSNATLYTRYSWQGVGLMMIIDLFMFGAAGLGRLGGANGVDAHHCGRHHQRCGSLLGLPQLRSDLMLRPIFPPGASSLPAKSCTTITTPIPHPPSCR